MENYCRTTLQRIKHDIYEVWNARFNKIYSDTDWHYVFDFVHALECIYGVEGIEVSSGKYYHYFDGTSVPPYREYEIIVNTDSGTLSGVITCCSAGTTENPFSRYDILISVEPDPKPAN